MIKKCRVCNNNLIRKSLLSYKNMPSRAQFLPDAKSIIKDKGINLNIYQCLGCGLVQLSSNPVPYYKEVIRASAFSKDMKNYREKQFANLVNKLELKDKKVIEIGCGKGEYLHLMQKAGTKAYGLEFSRSSVEQGTRNGLKVLRGFVGKANYKIRTSPFDAFFMLNFLEHLPQPNLTLQGIANNLSDNGVGLVEVPNFNMILQSNLFSEFTSDHLFYFTKETLSTTLNLNGFEIIECRETWHNYILSAVIRKRKNLNLSKFDSQQIKLKKELNSYINRFNKVAIWGAGHQSLAVISLTDIGKKIKYVIDSAPFKQNKFTPATHIPIVSPSKLNFEPIDAIIVIAASYSDEVVKTILEKFDKTINVAVLKNSGLEIVN